MERFPEDFMFELMEKETPNLRSQFVISSWGGNRYKPFADYNDINEDTRMQMELFARALAELQLGNRETIRKKRPRIGFIPADD